MCSANCVCIFYNFTLSNLEIMDYVKYIWKYHGRAARDNEKLFAKKYVAHVGFFLFNPAIFFDTNQILSNFFEIKKESRRNPVSSSKIVEKIIW